MVAFNQPTITVPAQTLHYVLKRLIGKVVSSNQLTGSQPAGGFLLLPESLVRSQALSADGEDDVEAVKKELGGSSG